MAVDCQQNFETITVFRAGTKHGPSFDLKDESINEVWLVREPKLFFPLLGEVCLWEADLSDLRKLLRWDLKFEDAVVHVKLKDSRNSKDAVKEIQTHLRSLVWRRTTVPQCGEGFPLLLCNPLIHAVEQYMNNHLPTTPKELNFHAELKAVSRWRWLGGRLYLAMKESLDSRRKIAAEETLKSWKKLEAEFLLNEIYSPGLSFLCFDVSGYIQALEKYLRMTAEDDLPEVEMATVNEEEQFESANGNSSAEDDLPEGEMATLNEEEQFESANGDSSAEDDLPEVEMATLNEEEQFESANGDSSVTAEDDLPEGEMATLNEEEQFESANVLLVKDPKLYVSLNEEIKRSVRGQKGESLENVCPWKRDIAKLSEYFSQKEKFDGIFQVELKDSTNASCALRIQEIQRCLKFNSLLVQAVIVYVKDHSPTTPEELNFHAELKAARHWCWLDDHKQLVMKRVPVGDCRLKIAATETLKTWKKMEKELQTIKANKMGAVILRFDVLSSSYETSEGPFVSYLLPAEVQDCHTMMDC